MSGLDRRAVPQGHASEPDTEAKIVGLEKPNVVTSGMRKLDLGLEQV